MAKSRWFRVGEYGFYCDGGEFYIDPKRSTKRAIISHAHADHYPRYMGEVYAHPATIALATARYKNLAGREQNAHEFFQPFRIGPIEITLLPAGHMLGSAQIMLHHTEYKETVLYSGDFALQANASCTPLSCPDRPIDLLICESTFGLKDDHGNPEGAMREMLAATSLPLLIATYAMGKAQRISQMLGALAPDLPVLVDRSILPFHKVYSTFGIDLGNYRPYQRKWTKSGRFAYLVPPKSLTGYSRDVKFYKVFASGWNKQQQFHYLQSRLDISDHASGAEIRTYIDHIQPKEVWFWHGYPQELLSWCAEKGLPAKAV